MVEDAAIASVSTIRDVERVSWNRTSPDRIMSSKEVEVELADALASLEVSMSPETSIAHAQLPIQSIRVLGASHSPPPPVRSHAARDSFGSREVDERHSSISVPPPTPTGAPSSESSAALRTSLRGLSPRYDDIFMDDMVLAMAEDSKRHPGLPGDVSISEGEADEETDEDDYYFGFKFADVDRDMNGAFNPNPLTTIQTPALDDAIDADPSSQVDHSAGEVSGRVERRSSTASLSTVLDDARGAAAVPSPSEVMHARALRISTMEAISTINPINYSGPSRNGRRASLPSNHPSQIIKVPSSEGESFVL
jgi:hypothetical protein